MDYAYTAEHIEEMTALMEYGVHFFTVLLIIACLALVFMEIPRAIESHRIWKELRKLEKEKLEQEKKVADKELETYSHSRFVNVDILEDQLRYLRKTNDNADFDNCITEIEFFIEQQFNAK